MGALYTVTGTTPEVYIDNSGQAINGFRVSFTIHEFDEGHFLNVPKQDPVEIDRRIKGLIADRKKLAALGG
jgi:hypothetical protein